MRATLAVVALLGFAASARADAPSRYQLLSLPVPDFRDAVVSMPPGEARLPVIVATHGAGGDPEWTCEAWGTRTAASAIVLCPRGRPISRKTESGFYYPEHFTLEKEVFAALHALTERFGPRVQPGPMLYTGYSQGATMGALFLTRHGARFPYMILTEGGSASFSKTSAKRFKESGGKRVLFVCGGTGCRKRALESAALLERAGVEARVEYVPGGGHADWGSVGERLDATYRWAWGPLS